MQSEYFVCENCQRNIPIINRTVHAVRCVAVPNTQSSFNSSSSGIISEENPWICSRCTFSNTELVEECEICGTSRNHNVLDNDSESISDHERPEQCCTHQDHNQAQWQCSSCTYLNLQLSDVCMMCQNPRPPISSVRETLLPSYTGNDEFFDEIGTRHHNRSLNRSWSQNSTDNHQLEDELENTAGSMLLGAGLGASLAWLNNSDITNGALTGAGLGVIGDLLLREMTQRSQIQRFPRSSSRIHEFSSEGIPNERYGIYFHSSRVDDILRQMLLAHQHSRILNQRSAVESQIVDVDGMPFEELLARFPQPARGVEEDVLASLPVRTYGGSTLTGSSSASVQSSRDGVGLTPKATCSICLEEYQSGEEVKTLPCLHCFHCNCVDHWLRQHRTCPICKHVVDGI